MKGVFILGAARRPIGKFGGAIALGHPSGCTVTRIMVTPLHEMLKRQAVRGLATLSVFGDMGMALEL